MDVKQQAASVQRLCNAPPPSQPAIGKRNLLFYLCPLRNPARVWQWHVRQLRKHLKLFNGRRIVAIATGEPLLDSPEFVCREFGKDAARIEFVAIPNANTWEAAALKEMLGMVESTDHSEASFYFHAKGVRRIDQSAIRPWCEAIYRANLDDSDALQALRASKACGAFARLGDPSGTSLSPISWHFAGNAWWVRHDALFASNWDRSFSGHTHGAEAYLSTRFHRHEVHDLASMRGDLYDPATWRRGPKTPKVSVIVTARNYGRYLRDCLESCLWQDRAADEVVYCDDASDDDSLATARRFCRQGLKVIALKQHQGVVKARNQATVKTSGDALLFVDGDNILPRDFLAQTVKQFRYHTPFVYTDLCFFGDEAVYHQQPEWADGDIWQTNHCDTCSLINRRHFDLAGGWIDDTHGTRWSAMEDYHLFLRLSLFGAARRADVALSYRRHRGSLTGASGRTGRPDLHLAAEASLRADVERWAIERFGRLPSRAERDQGVLAS